MMSKNGTISGGPTGRPMPTTIKPKKKPPPPRPPQPKINRLQASQSFNTAQDLFSVRNDVPNSRPGGGIPGRDLIDFSTPPGSPSSGRRNTVSQISTALKDPNEFSYRVGASIFYIKSPLKNSIPEKQVQNPFSPPRPSADSMNTNQQKSLAGAVNQSNLNSAWSPIKTSTTTTQMVSAWDTAPVANTSAIRHTDFRPNIVAPSSTANNTTTTTASSLENNNTIKSNYPASSPWSPVGASSSSNASSDRTSAAFSDFSGNTQPRYSNVPSDNLKKELSATLSTGSSAAGSKKPTIIRPTNKVFSQSSNNTNGNSNSTTTTITSNSALMKSIKNEQLKSELEEESTTTTQRNYYDVPPEEDDFDDEDDDDDLNNSSILSPPMPSEPPPPPPPDVMAVDEWVNSTTGVTDYPDTYSDAGQVTAYAIALYDFTPEAQGDLPLQAGDLVYLIRKVDDSWYQGSCGGMEGMFPSNFVNIMVPLPEESSSGEVNTEEGIFTDVLYDFPAETDGDLTLQAGEKIRVLGRINEDWLYGEKDGIKGQFPAAFVQTITQDLPIIKI